MKNYLFILSLFVALLSANSQIVINEINYKDALTFQTKDWIELYNNGSTSVDISDWVFKDNDDLNAFIIPSGTIMQPDSYLVLSQFLVDFQNLFPSVNPVIGDFTFGLSGGGELIRLFNDSGDLVDSVEFDDIAPWPIEPDGNGPTLELINPNLDNSLASSWGASILPNGEHGTPSEQNSVFDAALGLNDDILNVISVYPNPLIDKVTVQFSENIDDVILNLYDVLGNNVKSIKSSSSKIIIEKGDLTSGIYMLEISTKNKGQNYTQKLIIK